MSLWYPNRQFPPLPHASTHEAGGSDPVENLNRLLIGGTEVITSNRVLQNVTASRSIISDFWNSPFWDNIPDKPSAFPPESHASSHLPNGSDPLFDQTLNTTDDVKFNTIQLGANAIKDSTGTTRITLGATVTISANLKVTQNSVKGSDGTTGLNFDTANRRVKISDHLESTATITGELRRFAKILPWTEDQGGEVNINIQGKTPDGYHIRLFPCNSGGSPIADAGKIGNTTYYWNLVAVNTLNYKSSSSFACDPAFADKPVPRSFNSSDVAMQLVKKLIRKDFFEELHHMPYVKKCKKCGKELPATYEGECPNCKSNEIVMGVRCVCGKWYESADMVCHKEEFEDRYFFPDSKFLRAIGYAVVDLKRRVDSIEQLVSYLFDYVKEKLGGVSS